MTDGSSASVRRWPPRHSPWSWGVHLAVVVAVLVLNLVQQPGRITFDTKLDLQLNPADLLVRSADLWNADWALGGLQNQASGYLFPMGPAFLLGEVLGAPMWVWQRLWSALVMLLAYEGARRLAASWPGIGQVGAVLAGLTYMLSPRVLTTVGGLSGETLPAAVLPWTVLPMVLFLRGRLRGWVAFVLSAATVPVMGGQNATLVVACLVLPALLLLLASGRSLRQRATHLVAWGSLVGLASVWWVVPLLLLGSYAPPFLDFIESANNTAGATGWLSSLRGTSHWVAFFPGGGQIGWEGGYELASSRWLLVPTVLVAGVGLVGLLQRDLWQRRVLAVSVLVGLGVLTAGSGGWAGSVLADTWLHALDTTLAPLRNIHKFDPVVRLPLSLGLAALVTSAVPHTWRRTTGAAPVPVRPLVLGVVTLLVLAAAGPAAAGSLRTKGGFDDIAAPWREAVAYLAEQSGPTRTIVLPGAGFAVQTWGRTIDEPIQVLDPSPWMARAQVTVAPAGTLRLLDSVEQSVADPRPLKHLAAALEELGVTHVVVRNDLDPEEVDAPDPQLVHAAIANVPGARLAASFGSTAGGPAAIEVFELRHDDEPRVELQAWDDRVVVDGAPEIVPDLRAAGLVREDQAAVLAVGDEAPDVVTDSLRRVERSFGRVHDARSGVMTAGEAYRVDRLAHDHSDDAMPASRTTAAYDGVARISASTSAGYADILGPVRPEQHPWSAFDRSIYTAWGSAPLSRPQGQWIEATFDRPTPVREVSLAFDTFSGAPVTSVRISTEDRSTVAEVEPNGAVPAVRVDDDAASTLRVTVLGAGVDRGQVRLSDVRIAGRDVSRSLVVPGAVSSDTAVFLSSEIPRRACAVGPDDSVVGCELAWQRETSETPGFDRTITVEESGEWTVKGHALATHGPLLAGLFAPLAEDQVDVVATSTYGGDPAVGAAGALDGRPETGWTSAPGDPGAALQLTWGPRRTVSRIDVSGSPDLPGDLPEYVVVEGGPGTGEPQLVATRGAQAGVMQPVRTNRLRVTAYGQAGLDGVGISELDVAGIEDLLHRPDPGTPTGTACGFGPSVEVAGRTVQTRISGTLGDVRSGRNLAVIPCGKRSVALTPGEHRVRVTNPEGFVTSSLVLAPDPPETAAAVRPSVRSWSSTHREVEVSSPAESVLGVAESFNRGWTASIDGTDLAPVVLDGWRQGFVVPAGTRGVVSLDYAPQVPFRVALLGGLGVVALLLLLAVGLVVGRVGRLRGEDPAAGEPAAQDASTGTHTDRPTPGWRDLRSWSQAPALVVLALVSLPLALGALGGWISSRRPDAGLVDVRLGAACLGAFAFSGAIALSTSAVVVPPVGSDVVVALAVGAVCGRVFTSSDGT
ncbi:alpha-(1-_3)-arabinofuranosyltransferase domain-containing protein [Nocardioides flavus (ex Wang et al. 2016)]|uniref:alpha-(1->3)-arabinofuranosyltransferase domain-containing protein n=1 Tax=Nocardioides flavus (ex Wang et al. 2016) TaxID=2058780 RepID=UPI00174C2DF6|nr:alpha-(1->3)-arabinofuranosyltransferase family protein [Nocardioides flavus (ex Wang et al. 2016)]